MKKKNSWDACLYSYEQILQAVPTSSRKVHRILTRLRTMGFLITNIPIYYGEPTIEMVQTVRRFKLMLPFRKVVHESLCPIK